MPVGRKLTSVPFARHPASLCHVSFGSSLLRRWGWKLAWRRKVFLSNLPALRYGSCALPWGRSRQEAVRLGRLRRGHRSLRSHPGPGVPAPGVLSLPLLFWEPKGPCASWEKNIHLTFPDLGGARSLCQPGSSSWQAPRSYNTLPCPGKPPLPFTSTEMPG